MSNAATVLLLSGTDFHSFMQHSYRNPTQVYSLFKQLFYLQITASVVSNISWLVISADLYTSTYTRLVYMDLCRWSRQLASSWSWAKSAHSSRGAASSSYRCARCHRLSELCMNVFHTENSYGVPSFNILLYYNWQTGICILWMCAALRNNDGP